MQSPVSRRARRRPLRHGLTSAALRRNVAVAGKFMVRKRVSVSLDPRTLRRLDRWVRDGVYPSRSRAIEGALGAAPTAAELRRFARACRDLDPEEEASLAEEWLDGERERWRES